VKQHNPIYNQQLRSSKKLFSLTLAAGLNRIPLVNIVSGEDIHPPLFEYLYGLFRSKRSAIEALRKIVLDNKLCPRMLGLESGKGICFSHQLKRCDGACAGKESPEFHYLRLKQALVPLRLKAWPYPGRICIREMDENTGRAQLHVFESWCYLGTAQDEEELLEIAEARISLSFDPDIYNLLQKRLNKETAVIYLDKIPRNAGFSLAISGVMYG
jgi:DNA polymerase-3 subunit epsilon